MKTVARLIIGLVFTLMAVGFAGPVAACGGLFCDTDPVSQAGERIVFTVNDDETITSLIEIQYSGSAPDFSWILPIPEAIGAEGLAVPDNGQDVFDELHQMTDVQIRPPARPECALAQLRSTAADDSAIEADGEVEVFASGEVGPFGFDIIGAGESTALIDWLRDNNYRVEPPMEPLIDVYVEEEFAFIAMRLLDGETSDSIAPIEITYPGTQPMIPLRLTAVAANVNMPIWVWFFAQDQVVPDNFGHMEIDTRELTFFSGGGNNYRQLVMSRANAMGGQSFITEYAQEVNPADFENPYLGAVSERQPYLTRLATFIDPAEMTLDPTFKVESGRDGVSNVRDAGDLSGLYRCERDGDDKSLGFVSTSDAIDPTGGGDEIAATTPDPGASTFSLVGLGVAFLAVIAMVGGLAYAFGSRTRAD